MTDIERATLMTAIVILRDFAVSDRIDPVISYRCSEAALELATLRRLLMELKP